MKIEYKVFIVITIIAFSIGLFSNSFAYAQPYDGSIGVVTIDFHHEFETQYPAINADMTGLAGTLEVIVQRIGTSGYMTEAQLHDLEARGFEIISHSETHYRISTKTPPDQLNYEIVQSKADLQNMGFKIHGFIPPYHLTTPQSLAFVQKNYDFMEMSSTATAPSSIPTPTLFVPYVYNTLQTINYSKQRYGIPVLATWGIGNGDKLKTFAEVKTQIDYAIAHKILLGIHFHSIDHSGSTYNITPEIFQEVIQYIKQQRDAGKLQVMTHSQALGFEGNSSLTTVAGTAYDDLNDNGKRDVGESGIPGIMVTLYSYSTSSVVNTTITNSLGNYSFSNVPVGGVAILETIPQGTTNTQPGGNTPSAYYTSVLSGQTTTFDFGNHKGSIASTVSGTVYNDLNSNGEKDTGESGTSSVPITLYSYTTGQIVGTTITESNGNYSFSNVPVGGVAILETIPQGTTNTQPGGNTPSAYYTSVLSGQTTTFDFGNHKGSIASTVSGTVYNDLNSNGEKDTGESGTSSVPITLYSYTTGQIVGTTITESNGNYSFSNVPVGGIAVFETIPAGDTNLQPGGTIPGTYYSSVSAGQTGIFDFGNH